MYLKLQLIITLILSCTLFLGCSDANNTADSNELSQLDPLTLLEALEKQPSDTWFTVQQPIKHWVQKKHLARLIALLDSNQPCAPVVLAASSYLPRGSTVGQEAAFLINGYISGEYPSDLYSGRLTMGKEDILKWWAKQNEKNIWNILDQK